MTIFKSNIALVFVCVFMLLNITQVSGCYPEFASKGYCDKVHEFLYYFGVENAYDVAVYKIDLQEEAKSKFFVRFGIVSGIWINERMWLYDPLIRTEQDLNAHLAEAAAFYAFGLKNIFLRWGGIGIFSAMPIIVTNVLLALLNRGSCAKSCTLWHKILIGSVANIVAIVGTRKLYKYLMDKSFSPYMQKHLEKVRVGVVQMLCQSGYSDAADAYINYLNAKFKKEA